jgi:pyrroline-5-carboxylate reductase
MIMVASSVGFIGAGRVAKIMLGAWKKGNALPGKVVLYDCNAEASRALKAMGARVEAVSDAGLAAAQDVVFLAVHPPMVKDALAAIQGKLRGDAILVSLAPKFTTAKISEMLGGFKKIARMIPNAPTLVGRGYNPQAHGAGLDAADKAALVALFKPLGECPVVEERHLEAYAILSAMGPTYFWPQIQALKTLGESFGLSSDATMEALDKMLWGAMATVRESGLTPEQVHDLIPVKPMAEEVEVLAKAYGNKLNGLMDKIRP